MMQEKPRLLQEQTGTQNSVFYILLWSLDIFFSRVGESKEKSKHHKSDGSALTDTDIPHIYLWANSQRSAEAFFYQVK